MIDLKIANKIELTWFEVMNSNERERETNRHRDGGGFTFLYSYDIHKNEPSDHNVRSVCHLYQLYELESNLRWINYSVTCKSRNLLVYLKSAGINLALWLSVCDTCKLITSNKHLYISFYIFEQKAHFKKYDRYEKVKVCIT